MSKKKPPLLLGAHMPITGGLYKALERAASLGCTTVQFFSKSNRQWRARELTDTEIELFKQRRKELAVHSVTIHASYLINIGSPEQQTAEKSLHALQEELKRADTLGADYLVFHPGAHRQQGQTACLDRIAHNINLTLEECPDTHTKLLLETMAGQGSTVCYAFEHLAYIYKRIKKKERIGICVDTCHIFAAGYDLTCNYDNVFEQFDKLLGVDLIKIFHINDSKKIAGSRVDRHEDIGKGHLGLEPFRRLFNDDRFFSIPKILETPKESLEDDARNIATIKKLLSENTRERLKVRENDE